MIQKIRGCARRFLHPSIRRPLGSLGGQIYGAIILPFLGLIFDLSGGTFSTDGCSFRIPKNITSIQFRACFLTGDHEVDERKLIPKFILPDDAVLELGGCLGVVACITNQLLRDRTRHVVVEANPNCLPALYRNRDHNRAGFLIEHCAASNVPRVEFFLNPRGFITGSTTVADEGIPVQVPGRSLRELNMRYGPFSVLVMDIEGGELEVLSQAAETLSQFRAVIIEIHESVIGSGGAMRCREMLRAAGLKMVEISQFTEVWLRH